MLSHRWLLMRKRGEPWLVTALVVSRTQLVADTNPTCDVWLNKAALILYRWQLMRGGATPRRGHPLLVTALVVGQTQLVADTNHSCDVWFHKAELV